MKGWKKGLFFSDTQGVAVLPQTIAMLCAYMKDYKPDLVVWGGDIVDFAGASKFIRHTNTHDYLVDEIKYTDKEIVQPVLKAAPKAKHVWLEGNHEYRLRSYIATFAPALTDFPGLSIHEVFKMKARGIEYIPGKGATKNGIYQVSKNVMCCHGTKTGQMAAKQLATKWDRGLAIQGHVHKRKSWDEKKGSGRHIAGVSAPCLCADPDFGDGMDDYTRGFVTFQWKGDDYYRYEFQDMGTAENSYTELYSDLGIYRAVNTNKGWIVRGE